MLNLLALFTIHGGQGEKLVADGITQKGKAEILKNSLLYFYMSFIL